MRLSARSVTLHLAETFTISKLSSDARETCIVTLEGQGLVAFGEGSPDGYGGETIGDVLAAVEADGPALVGDHLPDRPEEALRRVQRWSGPTGAKMALDGVLHDWWGKRTGQPLWRLLGGRRVLPGRTGFTIGLATVEETVAKVRRAPAVGALKVKVGGPADLERLEAVRRATTLPIRIDANEGWTFETARVLVPRLAELGVALVEQPFPVDAVADYHRYRDLPGRLPVFVDEACTDVPSVVRAADYADGVVVKLSESGGIAAAREVVETARSLGLAVMVSCNVESELGICQAAQLGCLADIVDLDSHLMIRDSPFTGLGLDDGRIVLTDRPGLGLTPR
jgi:L-Ala-D/L-Glu epimerase